MSEETFFSWLAIAMLVMILLTLVMARRAEYPCTVAFGETHNFVKTDDDHAVCSGCGMKLKRRDQWVRDFSK